LNNESLPLKIFDDPAFIALINGLNPRGDVMDVKKLRLLIDEKKQTFEKELICAQAATKLLCLTADIWSISHRSWIGIC
jgi:hypothetical protein